MSSSGGLIERKIKTGPLPDDSVIVKGEFEGGKIQKTKTDYKLWVVSGLSVVFAVITGALVFGLEWYWSDFNVAPGESYYRFSYAAYGFRADPASPCYQCDDLFPSEARHSLADMQEFVRVQETNQGIDTAADMDAFQTLANLQLSAQVIMAVLWVLQLVFLAVHFYWTRGMYRRPPTSRGPRNGWLVSSMVMEILMVVAFSILVGYGTWAESGVFVDPVIIHENRDIQLNDYSFNFAAVICICVFAVASITAMVVLKNYYTVKATALVSGPCGAIASGSRGHGSRGVSRTSPLGEEHDAVSAAHSVVSDHLELIVLSRSVAPETLDDGIARAEARAEVARSEVARDETPVETVVETVVESFSETRNSTEV